MSGVSKCLFKINRRICSTIYSDFSRILYLFSEGALSKIYVLSHRRNAFLALRITLWKRLIMKHSSNCFRALTLVSLWEIHFLWSLVMEYVLYNSSGVIFKVELLIQWTGCFYHRSTGFRFAIIINSQETLCWYRSWYIRCVLFPLWNFKRQWKTQLNWLQLCIIYNGMLINS